MKLTIGYSKVGAAVSGRKMYGYDESRSMGALQPDTVGGTKIDHLYVSQIIGVMSQYPFYYLGTKYEEDGVGGDQLYDLWQALEGNTVDVYVGVRAGW